MEYTGDNVREGQRIRNCLMSEFVIRCLDLISVCICSMGACLLSHVVRQYLYIRLCSLFVYVLMHRGVDMHMLFLCATLIIIVTCIRACISYFIN